MKRQSIRYRKNSTRHAPKAHASSGRLTDSHVLSRLFSIALIGTLVLSIASCRSTKKLIEVNHSEQSTVLQADSELVSMSETTVRPVKVPMSTVSLTLKIDSLHLLPLGASYTARQGQAHLKVMRKPLANSTEPGEVIIEANCDSLELVVMQLTKTVCVLKKRLAREQHMNEYQLKEQKEQTAFNSVQTAFKWLLIGIAMGWALTKTKLFISFINKYFYGK